MEPAFNIQDVYKTINPDKAVSLADPRFVDLSAARGDENLITRIVRRICAVNPGEYHRHIITGHRGSGKSTELGCLRYKLESRGYLVAYFDVQESLDIADIEYLDLLIGLVYALENLGIDRGINIKAEYLRDIEEWFAEITSVKDIEQAYRTTIGGGVELNPEVPFLAKILASITSQIQNGSTTRTEIRQKVEQRLEEFFYKVNLFIDEFTRVAKERGYLGVVAIIDSLEKMTLKIYEDKNVTNHSLLFVEHAEQLKKPNCHIVYTVPVSPLNDRNLGIAYNNVDIIPMVRISDVNGIPWKDGLDLLFDVVSRRVDPATIFESNDLIFDLIKHSGGAIRDLMRLILSAADYTPVGERITERAVKRAKQNLIREYDRLIHEEDIVTLCAVLRNPFIPNNTLLSRLMYNRLVLPYITEDNWYALHPAVKESPTFRAASQNS